MKTKPIVSFLGVAIVMIILLAALARGGVPDAHAQEGKQKRAKATPTVTKK